MNSENNNFNNDNELEKENASKSNETVNENAINYSAVSGSKEYIYNHYDDAETKEVKDEPKIEYTVNEPVKPKPKRQGRKFLSTVAVILVVSLISGAAGGFMTSYYYKNNDMLNNNKNINNAEKQSIAINLNDSSYFAAAVNEKAKDTVVGITTTTVQSYSSFWGGRQDQEVQSIGSGVIVDPDGLILTNSHVIGDGQAKNIVVSLVDGSTEQAEVLWYDSTLDLAVVKINKTGLSAAELGDSDTLMVGEPVVAIGNPMSLDLNGTLTTGVVSGLNRSITIDNVTIKPLIQTDASINPGNSGGPLFNSEGKIVGINTAKMSSAEGLGFSIPVNTVVPILEQIKNEGTVTSVYVGITGTSVADYEQRLGIDLTAEFGVIVIEVENEGPVFKAGLASGDIIIAIDNTDIKDMSDLKRALYQYKAGDKVQVKYIRDGSEKTVEVTLKERPKDL